MKKQVITFNNYEQAMDKIHIHNLPEVLQNGHQFFLEAKEHYHTEPIIRDTIDIYLKQLNENLFTKKDLSKYVSTKELYLIKSFLAMHRKVLAKEDLKKYIFELQNAIDKKEITKDSAHASHIEEIQHKLIKQFNSLILKTKVKIIINRKWRLVLQEIAKGDNLGILNGYRETNNYTNPAVTNPVKKRPGLFSPINQQRSSTNLTTFSLKGALGVLLGDIERFELAITIEGDQGGGKTRFTYQMADAFAEIGNKVAIFSLEIGSRSDLITRMKQEYLKSNNQNRIFITDQLPEGYKSIEQAAKEFDVIIIDSWNKTGLPSQDFDKLRKENPNTIFIVIFQRTTQKTIRGGTAPLFDAGINIEVVKADDTFKNNYAVTSKNRYGITGIKYNIYQKAIVGESIPEYQQEDIVTETIAQ